MKVQINACGEHAKAVVVNSVVLCILHEGPLFLAEATQKFVNDESRVWPPTQLTFVGFQV